MSRKFPVPTERTISIRPPLIPGSKRLSSSTRPDPKLLTSLVLTLISLSPATYFPLASMSFLSVRAFLLTPPAPIPVRLPDEPKPPPMLFEDRCSG